MAGWFTDRTGVAFGDAVRMVKLGDVLDRSTRLTNAVLSGQCTSAAAENLHTAIVQGPAGADIDALLDALLGPRTTPDPDPDGDDLDEPPSDNAADDSTSDGDGDGDGDDPTGDGHADTDAPGADDADAADGEAEAGLPFGDAPTGPDAAAGAGSGGGPGPSAKEARDAANTFKRINQPDHDPIEAARKRRGLSFSPGDDGLVNIRGQLPVLDARIVQNALEHIGGQPDHDDRAGDQRRADALVALAQASASGQVAGGRERPQVIVTIDADSYLGLAARDAITAQGDRLPPEVARRLAECADLSWVLHTGLEILAQGRNYRYATDAQWKALVARDGGCRWPGCTMRATWCEADHIIEWEHGGPTDIDWLHLLCPFHHHVRHQRGAKLHGNAHDLTLERPDGTMIPLKPKGVIAASAAGPPGSRRPRSSEPAPDAPCEQVTSTTTVDDLTLFATG